MSLYMIGLGLGDHKDITIKGAEAIKAADRVFLEMYTSVLGVDVAALEKTYGKKVELADRGVVESASETILAPAREGKTVAFLVVGDALCATTHTDFAIRALDEGIDVHVIHNASIMNAVASCGLQLYRFGETVSIPFFRGTWRPSSWLDKALDNRKLGLHTLCLLDIKTKEPDMEAMMRGKEQFLPPRFMTAARAARQILELVEGGAGGDEEQAGEKAGVGEGEGEGVGQGAAFNPAVTGDTMCVAVCRIGQPSQKIVAATLRDMAKLDGSNEEEDAAEVPPADGAAPGFASLDDMLAPAPGAGKPDGDGEDGEGEGPGTSGRAGDELGPPLHSLVLVGETHDLEGEMLRRFRLGSGVKVVTAAPAVIGKSGAGAGGDGGDGASGGASSGAGAEGEFAFRDPVSVVRRSGVHGT